MLCIVTLFALGKPVLAYGANIVPDTIRVGLRSAYRDQSSIGIKNTQLQVGYESQNKFVPEETLTSNTGFIIKPNQKQYHLVASYSTYGQAQAALQSYKGQGADGVVAHGGAGTWRVYLDKALGQASHVSLTGNEIIIQDGAGRDLLLCENQGSPSVFAGKSKSHSFDLTDLAKGSYRGWFEFPRRGSTLTAVNIVNYNDYLYGVVPAEMPASWPMEALKAQAVAARSVSIHQANRYASDGYNVCDTTYTQVYGGFSREHANTNRAVDETRGIIATYQGKVAETLYFSTSGGHTEDPQYVWGSQIPYLQAMPDPYETEPSGKPWTRTITLAEMDRCLQNQNITIGPAKGMRASSYTPSGRVKELDIIGTSGTHTIVRENIRTFFAGTREGSLRSRMFTIGTHMPGPTTTPIGSVRVYQGDAPQYLIDASGEIRPVGGSLVVQGASSQVTYESTSGHSTEHQTKLGDVMISGRGYGHGVGMSQSGAKGMAQAGHTYDQIIQYYYQGVTLER